MRIKLLRSLGSPLIKSLALEGDIADFTEGKTVNVAEDAAERLVESKLAERAGGKITAPDKAPEIIAPSK